MPFYELMLVLRPMPKKEVVDCLKRTANLIWKEEGVLRKIDYLGNQKLPYQARSKIEPGEKIDEGNYFLYHVSLPQLKLPKIGPELNLDVDISRFTFNKTNESVLPEDYECTLEEELNPPFFRKSVRPLLGHKNVRADLRRPHQIQQV